MSKVSFEDIGMVTATFAAREDMKPGQVVKITGNGEVGACTDGDAFCGLALSVRRGFAGVPCPFTASTPSSVVAAMPSRPATAISFFTSSSTTLPQTIRVWERRSISNQII